MQLSAIKQQSETSANKAKKDLTKSEQKEQVKKQTFGKQMVQNLQVNNNQAPKKNLRLDS